MDRESGGSRACFGIRLQPFPRNREWMKMSFKRKDIEIMAPVGSYESLRAAIDAGADSVYFGGS